MLTGKRINALPRHEIARGKSNLSDLFASGHRLKGRSLVMISFAVASDRAGRGARIRALFTVGKKQVPGAVERNRIKRLMREAYRLEKSLMLPFVSGDVDKAGHDVTFIAFLYRGRRDAVPSLQDFRDEMRRMMRAFLKMAGGTSPDCDER